MDTRPRLCAAVLTFDPPSMNFLQDEQSTVPPRRKHSSVMNVGDGNNEAFVTFLLRIRLIDGHDLVIRDASGWCFAEKCIRISRLQAPRIRM